MANAPRYRVVNKCFIAPHIVHPGSIITYTGDPGDHLEPLNEEARAAMDAWYEKEIEHVEKDSFGQEIRRVKFKPNASKRPVAQGGEPVERAEFTLVAEPPRPTQKDMLGLAEALTAKASEVLGPPGPAEPTGVADVPVTETADGTVIEKMAEPEKKAK